MKLLKKKYFIIIICTCGICVLVCGMANRNNTIFLVGLILIVNGYLLIRKELKSSTGDEAQKDC